MRIFLVSMSSGKSKSVLPKDPKPLLGKLSLIQMQANQTLGRVSNTHNQQNDDRSGGGGNAVLVVNSIPLPFSLPISSLWQSAHMSCLSETKGTEIQTAAANAGLPRQQNSSGSGTHRMKPHRTKEHCPSAIIVWANMKIT